jgi:hypothetical protein
MKRTWGVESVCAVGDTKSQYAPINHQIKPLTPNVVGCVDGHG